LAVQDPRERPADKADAADFAQLAFRDERSDFLSSLKLWRVWRTKSEELGSAALRRWCREHFLSWLRLREWTDVHRQLRDLVRERILPSLSDRERGRVPAAPVGPTAAPAAGPLDEAASNAIHRSLLAGLVANVGAKGEKGDYRTANGSEFRIHPSSVLVRRSPPWIIAAEIVETSRRYARVCARIQGHWIERIAPHLVERTRSEPHWLSEAGQVAAWERVALGGLTVIPRRRVPFGPIDPVAARDIFLHALVDGQVRTRGDFVERNEQLVAALEMRAAKERSAGLLIPAETRFAFYDARVPATVHSQPSFESWRRSVEARDPAALRMRPEDLIGDGASPLGAGDFPDALAAAGTSIRLTYRHAPGESDDGVTALVPLAAVNRIDPERLGWLVPGLLRELVEALLRSLPKRLRIRFQPAAEFAAGAVEALDFGQGPLPKALARHLENLSRVPVKAEDFDLGGLPPHLRMRVVVIDADGTVLGEGRDAAATLNEFRRKAEVLFADAIRSGRAGPEVGGLLRRGQVEWPVDRLPASIDFTVDGTAFTGVPAFVDEGSSVAVEVLERSGEAERRHRGGVRRLLALRLGSALVHHVSYLPDLDALALAHAPLGPRPALVRAIGDLAIEIACLEGRAAPRDAVTFERLADQAAERLHAATRSAASLIGAVLRARQETATAVDAPAPAAWRSAVEAIRGELRRLVPADFALTSALDRLRHLPRYLAAQRVRLRRLAGQVERDAEIAAEIAGWRERLARVAESIPADERERLEFLIEEYQVQRFAGELRTAVPISAQRLEAAFAAAEEAAPAAASAAGAPGRDERGQIR
jgi:ATP-dependent helicase HrpA